MAAKDIFKELPKQVVRGKNLLIRKGFFNFNRSHAYRVLFVLYAVAAFGFGLNAEFVFGHDGWCAARRGISGANFNRYGFWESGFTPIENVDMVPRTRWEQYWHHPAGMQILVGLSYRFLGKGEWQTRIVPALVMLLSLGMWWQISHWLFLTKWGRRASMWMFASTPMLVVYGTFVNMDPLVIGAAVASCWSYLRWRASRSWLIVALTFAISTLAAFSGWSWFLFAFCLAVITFIAQVAKAPRRFAWLVSHSLGSAAGFFLVSAHLMGIQKRIGTVGAFDFIFSWIIDYVNRRDPRASPIAAFEWIFAWRQGGRTSSYDLEKLYSSQAANWLDLFTPGLVALSVVFFALCLVLLFRRRFGVREGIALAFLGASAAWVRLFLQGAAIHEYWPSLAGLFFVIASADVFEHIGLALARVPRLLATLLGIAICWQVCYSASAIALRRSYPEYGHSGTFSDHHRRDVTLWRWLGEHTPPGQRVAFDRRIFDEGLWMQRRFYIDRAMDIRDFSRSKPTNRWNDIAFTVLDVRRFPNTRLNRVLADWLSYYRITAIDDFVVAHLDQQVAAPRVEFLRTIEQPKTAWGLWFGGLRHRSVQLRSDPVLAADLLRRAGLTDAANALAAQQAITAPSQELRHLVARYNLQISSGTPTELNQKAIKAALPCGKPFSGAGIVGACVNMAVDRDIHLVAVIKLPNLPFKRVFPLVSFGARNPTAGSETKVRLEYRSAPLDTLVPPANGLVLIDVVGRIVLPSEAFESAFTLRVADPATGQRLPAVELFPARPRLPKAISSLFGLKWIGTLEL